LKRNGLINRKDSHSPATRRFEREHPNELWQMDFKGDFNMRRGRCYPLSILDDHSRFAVGLFALTGTGGKGVNRCLIKTFKE
jgi:transposase InsO family protein